MTIAAASPLCTWLMAACISRAVVGYADDKPMSSGALGRRSGRRLRRRNASSKLLAGTRWSTANAHGPGYLTGEGLAAFCGSGISGLGSCFTFEGCPEYANLKHEPLFGDMSFFGSGLGGLKMKPVCADRRLVKVGAGRKSSAISIPVYSQATEWQSVTVVCSSRNYSKDYNDTKLFTLFRGFRLTWAYAA